MTVACLRLRCKILEGSRTGRNRVKGVSMRCRNGRVSRLTARRTGSRDYVKDRNACLGLGEASPKLDSQSHMQLKA